MAADKDTWVGVGRRLVEPSGTEPKEGSAWGLPPVWGQGCAKAVSSCLIERDHSVWGARRSLLQAGAGVT